MAIDKLSPEIFFGGIVKCAKALIEAEKNGTADTSEYDYSVEATCFVCRQPVFKVLRCSACKAIIYCGKECAAKHWKTGPPPVHKSLCSYNKRHMERREYYDSIVKSFPWGRLEADGTFNLDIARARFGVLGGTGTGYWSHRGGTVSHSHQTESRPEAYPSAVRELFSAFHHMDGADLLKSKHLTDIEGWKLEEAFIPYIDFPSAEKRPALLMSTLDSWDAWYEWRKLPKASPAALLMSFPLTVYRLLVHCLEVTSPAHASPNKCRPLSIHLLGAEVELNYLPIFAELALLLPYHDINISIFGSAPATLVAAAKSKPSSLVAKSSLSKKSTKPPIFEYTAPTECGGSTLAIHLCGDSTVWSLKTSSPFPAPDALIALNGGLGSYPEWLPVIQEAHRSEIPFGVSEYAEQSAEHTASMLSMRGAAAGGKQRMLWEYVLGIEANPFHRPGQRNMPAHRMPNHVNRFTIVVVKKD
ncbi:zinc finger MYND domain-containing protein 15 [Favolaschia claudopus]|uniref:Zinc finger MYND domain-containing protein 15 n=1 Tax=Favolaschia claudopus TaxID=2862362 RepID=A0AAW0CVX5_9AGAR